MLTIIGAAIVTAIIFFIFATILIKVSHQRQAKKTAIRLNAVLDHVLGCDAAPDEPQEELVIADAPPTTLQDEIKFARARNVQTMQAINASYSWLRYKIHNTRKWSIAKNGHYDISWKRTQVDEYAINVFDYWENFSVGFAGSKFIRTKVFLTPYLTGPEITKVIEQLQTFNNALENIWWEKYRAKMEQFLTEVIATTKAPEYYFYKYYYNFLAALRNLILQLMAEVVIPNVIATNLPYAALHEFDLHRVSYEKNIKSAIQTLANVAFEAYTKIMASYKDEVATNGPEFKVNYNKNSIATLSVLNPLLYTERIVYAEHQKGSKPTTVMTNKRTSDTTASTLG